MTNFDDQQTDLDGGDKQPLTAHQYAFPDPLLEDLVQLANEDGLRLNLVLTVGGKTVDGMLCSGAAYLDHLQARLVQGKPSRSPALNAKVDDLMHAAAQSYYRPESHDPDPDAWPPFFVHLLDVQVDGAALSGWRGRLVEVDGWTLGHRDH